MTSAGVPSEHDGEDNKATGFLDLPPELRNRIYFQYLEAPVELDLSYLPKRRKVCFYEAKQAVCDLEPSLLATCRFINAEATPILYGANSFEVNQECFTAFLGMIGASVAHLRRLSVITWLVEDHSSLFFNMLERANALDFLEIRVSLPNKKVKERIERFVDLLYHWVQAQRLARVGTQKKDLMEVLQLVSQGDRADEMREMLEQKLLDI